MTASLALLAVLSPDVPIAKPSSGATPLAMALPESSYVAWSRSRQIAERRRQQLLRSLQAQPDPSEGADVIGPITAWAQRQARTKRLHGNAIAQLRRSRFPQP